MLAVTLEIGFISSCYYRYRALRRKKPRLGRSTTATPSYTHKRPRILYTYSVTLDSKSETMVYLVGLERVPSLVVFSRTEATR